MAVVQKQSILVMLAIVAGGCTTSRGPLVVGSDDPAVNLPAMVQAGETGNKKKVSELVEELDDTDPAVRMFAIASLSELTGGETFGYVFYDTEIKRDEAVEKWRKYAGMPPDRLPVSTTRAASTRNISVGGTEGGTVK